MRAFLFWIFGGSTRLAAGAHRDEQEVTVVKRRPRLADTLRSPWVWAIVLGLMVGQVDLKAQYGTQAPTGLAYFKTTYSGYDAIALWADHDDGGGSCSVVVYNDPVDGLMSAYTCGFTPGIWKAAAIAQGATAASPFGAWDTTSQALMDSIAPDFDGYAALSGAQEADCPNVQRSGVYVNSAFQPVQAGDPSITDGGYYVTVSIDGAVVGWKFRSVFTFVDTAGGAGSTLSWEQEKWLENHGHGQYLGEPAWGSPPQGGWYSALGESAVSTCGGGGDPPPTCSGSCSFAWNGSSWTQLTGSCGSGCQCCPPSSPGSSTGDIGYSSCVAGTGGCGGGGGPCDGQGGDADGDGCCDNVDCDARDASKCNNCTSGCAGHGGDGDSDGCCADEDPDDTNPNNNCDTPCYLQGDADGDGCCSDVDCDDGDRTKCSNCGCTGICGFTWDDDEKTYVPWDNNTCGTTGGNCRCCPPTEDGEAGVRYTGTCSSSACPNKCDDHGGDHDNDRCCADLDEDDNDPEKKDGCECGCRDFIDKYWHPLEVKMRRWAMFGGAGQGDCSFDFDVTVPTGGGSSRTITKTINLCDLEATTGVAMMSTAQQFVRAVLLVLLAFHSALVTFWVLLNW